MMTRPTPFPVSAFTDTANPLISLAFPIPRPMASAQADKTQPRRQARPLISLAFFVGTHLG